MNASLRWRLVLAFAVILGVRFISASGGSDNLPPQGKEYSTVTFYVA